MATTSATKKILTIDDEQAIVDLIVDILESNNYVAISATKWTDAVDALNHEDPDLILLDLKMPTIHGTSMLDFIVNEGFDVPVIVVSGFVTEQVSEELRQQGVKGIVKKPFKARALLDEIEKNLQTPPETNESPADAMAALYNQAKAPATETQKDTPSMDALYGSDGTNGQKPDTSPEAPAQDILQALKRNAKESTPPKAPLGSNDLLDALNKQTPQDQTPQDQAPPAKQPSIENVAETPTAKPAPPVAQNPPKTSGPPPVEKPPIAPPTALSAPPPSGGPDFGVREHSTRPRRGRRKMDKGNMLFFGGITVVCLLVAGFLAVMQWVASEAPVALEEFKSDLESGVNAQMQQQMQQMKQQIQTQQIQQKIQKPK